ncbi:MAG: T9SS type A sorting domain-containing protein [bacterium]|jgi:hypothetical protein
MRTIIVATAACLLLLSGQTSAYNVYYGNMHSHTSYSDGTGTPSEAYAYARDSAQVDIQAITDHTHWLSSSEWTSLKSTADSYNQDGVFVALAGQEHGSLSTTRTGAFGHMNFYESTSLIPQYDNGGDDYRYNLAGTYAWIAGHYDRIQSKKLFAAFNHPYYSGGTGSDAQFHHFAYSVTGDSAMSGCEIRNGQRGDNYESEYFEALAKGWHVGATANQDNHNGMWGDQPNPNSGDDIYLTGVLADTLTREAVLSAMKDRRTFGVEVNPKSDRMAILYQCEGRWMGDIFDTSADTLHFDVTMWAGNDFLSVELLRNGTQIDFVSPGTDSFSWHPTDVPLFGESYYLVRAQQVDGDYLWSSPIWVTSTNQAWTAISSVNADDANGRPVLYGTQVTIKGLATAPTGVFSTVDNNVFVQDATGGVNVVDRNTQVPFLSVGDSVSVTGYVDQSAGLTRISSAAITVEATGLTPPEALLITTGDIDVNGEVYEGSLVRVEGTVITGGTWPDAGFDGSVTIDDGSGECTLFLDADTDIPGSPEPGGEIDIVGIVTQYDTSSPYTCCYRLQPRSTADITTSSSGIDVAVADGGIISRVLPNPTKGRLQVLFGSRAAGLAKEVTFYGVEGRVVSRSMVDAGETSFDWEALDPRGRDLPSGVYFAEVKTASGSQRTKIVLIR